LFYSFWRNVNIYGTFKIVYRLRQKLSNSGYAPESPMSIKIAKEDCGTLKDFMISGRREVKKAFRPSGPLWAHDNLPHARELAHVAVLSMDCAYKPYSYQFEIKDLKGKALKQVWAAARAASKTAC
jgi:hypothetical protein